MDCFVASLLAMTPEEPVSLLRRRQLPLLGTRIRLCDQPLQFGNAGAAIGARLEFCADVGGGTRAGCDGFADRVAADAEAGADDGTGIGKSVGRLARQQHAALVIAERVRSEQILDDIPVAGVLRRPNEKAGSIRSPLKDAARYTPPPKSTYSATSSRAKDLNQDCQPARSALSANR
jgi:hypothetical protein